MKLLETHSWPGNVRELENVIERAVITTKTEIISSAEICIQKTNQDIKNSDISKFSLVDRTWSPGRTLDDVERNVIIQALEYHHGNRTHTARALGISIRTLRNKISDYKSLGLKL
jgi:DNA-binding NtrC family response regulator